MDMKKQIRRNISLILIVAMLFTLIPASAFAATAPAPNDYSEILKDCSVTFMKNGVAREDAFLETETEADVSVKLSPKVPKCYMTVFAYAGGTEFDASSVHNIRLWQGFVKNGDKVHCDFMESGLPLRVGYKVAATMNVPVSDDGNGNIIYRQSSSQKLSVYDKNGQPFQPYDWPDASIDETELEEGATSLHLTLTADPRIVEMTKVQTTDKDEKTSLNIAIRQYPKDEAFDFESEDGSQQTIYNEPLITETFTGKEVQLKAPLKAGCRVRAIVYWEQAYKQMVPLGNDYEPIFNRPDDSVVVGEKQTGITVKLTGDYREGLSDIHVNVGNNVPKNASLIIKKYPAGTENIQFKGGEVIANELNVAAGNHKYTAKTAFKSGEKIAAFLLVNGSVEAQSQTITVKEKIRYSPTVSIKAPVSVNAKEITVNVGGTVAPRTSLIVKAFDKDDQNLALSNQKAVMVGHESAVTAGAMKVAVTPDTLVAGKKLVAFLQYGDVSASEPVVIGNGGGNDPSAETNGIEILGDFGKETKTVNVKVTGHDDVKNNGFSRMSNIYLTVGPKSETNADKRGFVGSATFTGDGVISVNISPAKDVVIKEGETIQAHLRVNETAQSKIYYINGESQLIGTGGSVEPPAPTTKGIDIKETSFTTDTKELNVSVKGYDELKSNYMHTTYLVLRAGQEQTQIGSVTFGGDGNYKVQVTIPRGTVLRDGDKVQAAIKVIDISYKTSYVEGESILVGGGATPEPPAVETNGIDIQETEITKDTKTVTVKVTGHNDLKKTGYVTSSNLIIAVAPVGTESFTYVTRLGQAEFTGDGTYEIALDFKEKEIKPGDVVYAVISANHMIQGNKVVKGEYVPLKGGAVVPPVVAPTVELAGPVKDNAKIIAVKLGGKVPAGAVLLVKAFGAEVNEFASSEGTFVGSVPNVSAVETQVPVSDKSLKAGEKLVAFVLVDGKAVATSEPIVIEAAPSVVPPVISEGVELLTKDITSDTKSVKVKITGYEEYNNPGKYMNKSIKLRVAAPGADIKYGTVVGEIEFKGPKDYEIKITNAEAMTTGNIFAPVLEALPMGAYTPNKFVGTMVTIGGGSVNPPVADPTVEVAAPVKDNATEVVVKVAGNVSENTTLLVKAFDADDNNITNTNTKAKFVASMPNVKAGDVKLTPKSGSLVAGKKLVAFLVGSKVIASEPVVIESAGSVEPPVVKNDIDIQETEIKTTDKSATVVVTNHQGDITTSHVKSFVILTTGPSDAVSAKERTEIARVPFTGDKTYTVAFNDDVTLNPGETVKAHIFKSMYYDTVQTYIDGESVVIKGEGGQVVAPVVNIVTKTVTADMDNVWVKANFPANLTGTLKLYTYNGEIFHQTLAKEIASVGVEPKANAQKVAFEKGKLVAGDKLVAVLTLSDGRILTSDATVIAPDPAVSFVKIIDKEITAGDTKLNVSYQIGGNETSAAYELYVFDGKVLDPKNATLLTSGKLYKSEMDRVKAIEGLMDKLKVGQNLQLVMTVNGEKVLSNIVTVKPSPNWGEPTIAVDGTKLTVGATQVPLKVNYNNNYTGMEGFFCNVTVYKVLNNMSAEELLKEEAFENPQICQPVGDLNAKDNEKTNGDILLNLKEGITLQKGDRLIAKLRLPHPEWEGEEQDFISAVVTVGEEQVPVDPNPGEGDNNGSSGDKDENTNPDVSKTETVEKADGTIIQTTTRADGVKIQTVTDKNGNTTAEVTVPKGTDKTIVTIPVKDNNAGKVVVIVDQNGKETIIRKVAADKRGLTFVATGNMKVIVKDNAKDFKDVPESFWGHNAVDFVASHGIFNGTSADTFSPNASVTRGMLACVLHNLENNPTGGSADFTDVDKTAYYKNAIDWAASADVVSGYGNGQFGPEDKITREQLACMLNRYAGNPMPKNATINFKDAGEVSVYAQNSVAWAVENGILAGKGGNVLDPKGYATRAEVAAMMMRFVNNVLF